MFRPVALIFTLLLPFALVAGDAPAPGNDKPVVVNPAPKPFLGVKVDENSTSFDPSQGLPITAVIPGSTAASMGIQVGDLLRAFNGAKIASEVDLAAAIAKVKVMDEITVELTRMKDKAPEKLTLKGQITVRPQVASINRDLSALREEVLALRRAQDERRAKELSLADMLKMLKEIEDNMPAAVAEFKKQYPNGEFNIQIKIDIVSDKTAKEPITIGNQPDSKLNPENVNAPVAPEKTKEKPNP